METKKTGAFDLGDDLWEIRVWAPKPKNVQLEVKHGLTYDMAMDGDGYWSVVIEADADADYRLILDGANKRPDPASRRQPEGVHGWSRFYAQDAFRWDEDYWKNHALEDYILYEIHVGTFTPEGGFEAAIGRLDDLVGLGVTAVQIMPVSPFPGDRNWGYDGVYPYAVQESYGGPDGLKSFVQACHRRGLAVVLDVVYNHLGPEANHLGDFGPYFTDKHATPWGAAINFDDAYCDHVRRFFIDTVTQWFEEFHIDALRLDAVYAIFDNGPVHVLRAFREEADRVEKITGRRHYLIAECDTNDSKLVRPVEAGGYGLDAQWADDFHHSIHALVTGERMGYYADFGTVADVAKAFDQALVYDGVYSPFRHKTVGAVPKHEMPWNFVVCIQNHDQVGNREMGERLSELVSFEMQKLVAGLMFVSPYIPLVFMGEEYGGENPFQYFVSHSDPDLVDAVRKGRANEFKSFGWTGEVPDPQSKSTFMRSKLDWPRRKSGRHRVMLAYYGHLIAMRKRKVFSPFAHVDTYVNEAEKILTIRSKEEGFTRLFAVVNFNGKAKKATLPVNRRNASLENDWTLVLASADSRWNGPGFVLSRVEDKLKRAIEVEVPAESLLVFQNRLYDQYQ